MGRFRKAWDALIGRVEYTPPPPPVVPGTDMRVSDTTLAEFSITGRAPVNPWTIPDAAPFAPKAPDGTQAQLAMDSSLVPQGGGIADIYQWAMNGAFSEGLGFLGYPYLAELTQRPEYRRVSEIFAAETTRKWIKLKGDEDRINLIMEKLDAHDIRGLFRRAGELDGFFGRAQIFIDLGDALNSPELAKPLVPKAKVNGKGKARIKNFKVIEPFWSYPGMYQSANPLDMEFYKPTQWYVMSTVVHATRLLTVVGREMPDMLKPAYSFGGLSLSQMIKPYVDNWLRTRQSVSDLLHSFSTMVLATDMSAVIAGKSPKGFLDRLQIYNQARDNRGILAINKDTEELTNVSTPLGTLDKLLAQSQEQIASVSGIPLVILLGVTPSGLNASSDGEVRTFYATVKSYQERVYRSPLQTIIDLIQLDIDGTIDQEITFDFIDLWEMSEKDKADIRKSDGDLDVAYVGAGIVDNVEVRNRIVEDENSPYFGAELSDDAPAMPTIDPEDDPDDEGGDDGGDDGPKGAEDGAFEENKHPRADSGKFGSGAGGASGGASGKAKAAIKTFTASPTVWKSKASGIEYVANPVPQVPGGEKANVRAQQEALEDAFADDDTSFFSNATLDPAELKSLQNQVARDQVVNVADGGTFNAKENGEAPLVIRGPNGLILIDGNHRASAALLAGGKLDAQVFDYDKWKAAQAAKKVDTQKSNREDDDALLAELTS